MNAISSYRGNRPTDKRTNTHTNRQDRLQYTVPLSQTKDHPLSSLVTLTFDLLDLESLPRWGAPSHHLYQIW